MFNSSVSSELSAEALKESGFEVFVLVVGKQVTRNLIEQVASKPWYDHVFQVSSFQDLSELLRRLTGRGIYLFISKQNILDSELLIGLK